MRQSTQQASYFAKVVIIGDSGVGKTNILLRLCNNTFRHNYVATIGVDFQTKELLVDDTLIRLQIWDTAGQERYRTIQSVYYKGAVAIVLVYAINDRASFNNIQSWIKQVHQHSTPEVCKIIIGNKRDLDSDERKVEEREGEELAAKFGIQFLEVSAKDGTNVEQIFQKVAKQVKANIFLDDKRASTKISQITLKNQYGESYKQKSCNC